MSEYTLQLGAACAVLALVVLRRANSGRWERFSMAEWLSVGEIGMVWLGIGVSTALEGLGFLCILVLLIGSGAVAVGGIVELARMAWQRKGGAFDVLHCLIAGGVAATAIVVITGEPLWV